MNKYIIVVLILLVLAVQTLEYVSYRDIISEPMETTPKPIPCIFDATKYAKLYPDLNSISDDPHKLKRHFIENGLREQRTPCGSDNIYCKFDPTKYLSYYGDLRNAFGSNTDKATNHYKTNGINDNERRVVCRE